MPRRNRRRQSGVRSGREGAARERRRTRSSGGGLLHGDVRPELPAHPGRAPLMSLTVFTNALLIDGTGTDPMGGAAVVVEDDRIKEVLPNGRVGPLPGPVTTLDLKGATLLPGLTDAHVHICAVEGNITDQHRYLPPSLVAAKALRRAEECLMQGFTTVRDAGGADYGFREAIEDGLYPGPRLLVSGHYISQTGGHGDKRRRAEWIPPIDCCIGMIGSIADGEAEVRKAAREQIRRDVNQIHKINLAREQSVQGLTYAYRAGCKIGSGSDLLGDMMVQRAVEFELKAQVMTPMEVLLSATRVNAELFRMSDRIGTVEAGKYADLVVVTGDPLRNLRVFQTQDNLKVIMKGGRLYKRTL